MKMTLSSPPSHSAERQTSQTDHNRSSSPNNSPRCSPRPSPRPQTKCEHTKTETHLSVNYRESSTSSKTESSPGVSSQDLNNSRSNISENNVECSNRSDSSSVVSKDRKDGRFKKKSAWYSVLYPTYKSRSEEFRRIFKEVPDDERLVVDYSCALQKEILVQGRLYVSQNYLCFYANIFGWETNVTIKWKEVCAITKEKTALVIPNAILIGTRSDKFFFTTFASRDKTYLMLFRVWQNALMDQPMSQQEMWQWVHQCYGEELGLTSDDEDYIAPGTEEDKLSASLCSFSEDGISNLEAIQDQILDEKMDEERETNTAQCGSVQHSDTPNIPNDTQLPTDMSDTSESDVEKGPSLVCSELHEGKILLNEVYSIHIDQLFTLLFTTSKFFLDFHAARKTTDFTQTEWQHNTTDKCKLRKVNFTIMLNQTVGPKTAQVTEIQRMLSCSKAGHLYAVNLESSNAGVPYAESFYVFVHYCLHRVSPTQSSIAVYAQIKYKKQVWGFVRSMIEKSVWQGVEEFYTSLGKNLQLEAEGTTCPTRVPSKIHQKRRAPRMPRNVELDRRGPTRSSIKSTMLTKSGIFRSEVATLIVFAVLIVLVVLNMLLYYKLWSLEEHSAYSPLDHLQVLKNPPKSHEEWLKLFHQQETVHTVEMQKWQRILKTAIQLLRQAEDSLNELQRSIHPLYTNKIVSILQNNKDALEDKDKGDL